MKGECHIQGPPNRQPSRPRAAATASPVLVIRRSLCHHLAVTPIPATDSSSGRCGAPQKPAPRPVSVTFGPSDRETALQSSRNGKMIATTSTFKAPATGVARRVSSDPRTTRPSRVIVARYKGTPDEINEPAKAAPGEVETPAVEAVEERLRDVPRPGVGSGKPTFNLRDKEEQPSWYEATTFSGQAPEIINGRLAMLGFVAAVIGEVRTHQTIVEQFQSAPAFVFSVVLAFSVATLIPIVHGTDYRPAGLLTPGAEIWNGRVAMIGLAGMILVEQRFGTSIFG